MSYFELDENSRTIEQPVGLSVTLRKHQLTSIAAMMELENQSTILVDKPAMNSGFCSAVQYSSNHSMHIDPREMSKSTFVLETNSAILADKVGSGKTYMMIGLMLTQKKPQEHNKMLMGTNHFSVKMMSTGECNNINLVVVPHNLIVQWDEFMKNSTMNCIRLNTISDFDIFCDEEYVEKQSPSTTYTRYVKVLRKNVPAKKIKSTGGSKTAKSNSPYVYRRYVVTPKKLSSVLGKTDTIILNLNRYVTFRRIFKYEKWARVIIDEMDSIKIPPNFSENGNFNWFLTATPSTLFNISTRSHVVKIFGNNPGLLPYFTVKNKNEYVDKSIVLPDPRVFMIESATKKIVTVLKNFMPTDVLKLINAGNMSEALNKLNCNVDTSANIAEILTKNIKTDLSNLLKELEFVKSLQVPNKETRITKIETEIARCNTKLESITEKINSIKDECCFICADTFNAPAVMNCCKNIFCLGCLIQSLRASDNKCPYCRAEVKNNKGYHVIGEKHASKVIPKIENQFFQMEKCDILENILKHIADNSKCPKILIFSDYRQTFDNIKSNIKKAGLRQANISGIPSHINNVINNFNTGDLNVLLLDSQHYGSGLNLQRADYVILFHRMSEEVETQVIGRAHRYGRTRPLTIIYMISDTEDKRIIIKSKVVPIRGDTELGQIMVPGVEPLIIPNDASTLPFEVKNIVPKATARKYTLKGPAPVDDIFSSESSHEEVPVKKIVVKKRAVKKVQYSSSSESESSEVGRNVAKKALQYSSSEEDTLPVKRYARKKQFT